MVFPDPVRIINALLLLLLLLIAKLTSERKL